MHGREAEAGATALGLRREERLEDALARLRVHPGPGVRDREDHVLSRREADERRLLLRQLGVARLDPEAPAHGHRVARVQRQVQQDLLDLAGVRPHRPERRARTDVELDVLGDHPLQHRRDAVHDGVQVERVRAAARRAAEREQLVGERRGTLGGLDHLLDAGARGMVSRQQLLRELAVPGDHAQQVVEVVRDPAGQLSERLEALRALQHAAGLALLGHVPGDAEHASRPLVARAERDRARAQRAPAAVGRPDAQLGSRRT